MILVYVKSSYQKTILLSYFDYNNVSLLLKQYLDARAFGFRVNG